MTSHCPDWVQISLTQIYGISLSWHDTPNTQIHDISLSWLGTDIPNTQIHDISLSWLCTDIPNTNTWLCVLAVSSQDNEMSCIFLLWCICTKSGQWEVMFLCVRVSVPSLDSQMSCICALRVSTQDSEMSCICVLGVSSRDSEISCVLTDTPNAQIHDISLSWIGTDIPNTQIHDIWLSWLVTDTPNARYGVSVPSQDSEMACICVLGYLFQVWTVRCHLFVR
jgi:hypothetical protein